MKIILQIIVIFTISSRTYPTYASSCYADSNCSWYQYCRKPTYYSYYGTCTSKRYDGYEAIDNNVSSCFSGKITCGYCGSKNWNGKPCAKNDDCTSSWCFGVYWGICTGTCKVKLTSSPTQLPTVNEIIIARNNFIDAISSPPSQFILNFDIFPQGTVDSWGSILRYTASSNNCCDWMDRWLLLKFLKNSYRLHFVAGSTVNGNRYMERDGVQGNTWNKIEVKAIGYYISLYINNIYCGYLPNTNRPNLSKLKVYAGDSFYNPANAKIRSLVFTPITQHPTKKPTLHPSNNPTQYNAQVPCTATLHEQDGVHANNVIRIVVDDNTYVFGVQKFDWWKMVAVNKNGNHINNRYMSRDNEFTAENWKEAIPFSSTAYSLSNVLFCIITEWPSMMRSSQPSDNPSLKASDAPSNGPSQMLSTQPSLNLSDTPSIEPSHAPSDTPSKAQSSSPSVNPSVVPSTASSSGPSYKLSMQPSFDLSDAPSSIPSIASSIKSSDFLSSEPSRITPDSLPMKPSEIPSSIPSLTYPTNYPSSNPTISLMHDSSNSTLPVSDPTNALITASPTKIQSKNAKKKKTSAPSTKAPVFCSHLKRKACEKNSNNCKWETAVKFCYDDNDLPSCNLAIVRWECFKLRKINPNCRWSKINEKCGDLNCNEYDGKWHKCNKEESCNWEQNTKTCYSGNYLPSCHIADSRWKCYKLRNINPNCRWSKVNKNCVDFNCSDHDGKKHKCNKEKSCKWEKNTKSCLGKDDRPSCSKANKYWKCNEVKKLNSKCSWSFKEKTCIEK